MTADPIRPIAPSLPDGLFIDLRNGSPAFGSLQRAQVDIIRYRQHQGRPIGHYWGGWNTMTTGVTTFRMARFDMLDGGCAAEDALMQIIPQSIADVSTTAGIYIAGSYTPFQDHSSSFTYPQAMRSWPATTPVRSPAIATQGTIEQVIGFDSVFPIAGCFYEDSVESVSDSSTTVVTSGYGPGKDILATQAGSYGTNARMIDRFMHVWHARRTVYNWCTEQDSYVEMAAQSNSYRYIFDQSVGVSGADPSNTGPAITMPNKYQAAGLDNRVRVYVWVYAAMSGNTDGGTLAVTNRTGVGAAMTTTPTPLVNGATIGGTGYAWYPSLGAFDPTATPYFESPTDISYDRICLMGRSEGSTDKLRIRAWMMAVYPSRA